MSNDIVVSDIAFKSEQTRWGRIQQRVSERAASIEAKFLTLLRYSVLGIAALALLLASILLIYGVIQQIGKTRAEPKGVAVLAEDVVPAAEPAASAPTGAASGRKEAIAPEVRSRTLKLYRAAFQRFERPGTKTNPDEIVDLIWSQERIADTRKVAGGMLLDKDGQPLSDAKTVALDALRVVEAAVPQAAFQQKLKSYRDAKKVQVCTEQVVNHSRRESYWDSFSTSCENWAASPIGCMESRTVNEPTVDNVCEMKFANDLESPAQSLANAIRRYVEAAENRIDRSQQAALDETLRNSARKTEGQTNMVTSGQVFLGFLAVMFLYLLIALERHHRTVMKFVAAAERAPQSLA